VHGHPFLKRAPLSQVRPCICIWHDSQKRGCKSGEPLCAPPASLHVFAYADSLIPLSSTDPPPQPHWQPSVEGREGELLLRVRVVEVCRKKGGVRFSIVSVVTGQGVGGGVKLCPSLIRADPLGVPGLVFAFKVTDLSRTPSMSTSE
jgi:hypothetical protein